MLDILRNITEVLIQYDIPFQQLPFDGCENRGIIYYPSFENYKYAIYNAVLTQQFVMEKRTSYLGENITDVSFSDTGDDFIEIILNDWRLMKLEKQMKNQTNHVNLLVSDLRSYFSRLEDKVKTLEDTLKRHLHHHDMTRQS